MGTVIQSSFDLNSTIPWPEGRPAATPSKEPVQPERKRPQSNQATALEGFLQSKPAAPKGSRKHLRALWRSAEVRIRNAAAVYHDPSLSRTVSSEVKSLFTQYLSTLKDALSEALEGIGSVDRLPHVLAPAAGAPVPRSFALACAFLESTAFEFEEHSFAAFLAAAEEKVSFEMSEIWNLKAMLEVALLDRVATELSQQALLAPDTEGANSPGLDESLYRSSSMLRALACLFGLEWRSFFEKVCLTEHILLTDPQRAYAKLDSETRESYRGAVADLAARSDYSEAEVARKAIGLAKLARVNPDLDERAKERRGHVGYYLVDSGQAALKRDINYDASFATRIRGVILKWPDLTYVLGIEVVTFAIVVMLISLLHLKGLGLLCAPLLLLPVLECAVALVNMLATRAVPPTRIPRLDFSKGIPPECATVVAVPVLFTCEAQVRQAVKGLEVRYLANRDPNLHFVLLSDLPDAGQQFDRWESLVELASRLVLDLDEKYARENKGRFFYFHRPRTYNSAECLWMGWERKRGKLIEFNRYLLNQGDHFAVKTGDTFFLKNIRYVITLDLDTQLPPGAARKLVGTLAHPLNRAVIDPGKNTVVEGYGILQPRVDISVRSATRSRFASLLSGDTGFDIYTRAVSDVYQDLFGEGIFTGKGIYEVEIFQKVLEHRFPCNTVLSHDLIEGVYARAGLVSDVEVVDDYPSHFSAFSRRKHRWVRGDWQIIFSLLPQFQNHFGDTMFNPMSYISRWKVFDNLRRSLTDFSTMLLFLYGWLLSPTMALHWTVVAVALLLFPTCFHLLLFGLTAGRAWFKRVFWLNLCRDFASALDRVCVRLAFLCHQSLIDLDAVVRTVIRMKFTHRRLLEWETAAEAELRNGNNALVEVYLKYSLLLTVAMGPLVYLLHPRSLAVAMPFLILWAASAWLGDWLNQPHLPRAARIKPSDCAIVRNAALRTWRFFREFSNPSENWLIPDIVQKAPPLVAHRISPTNLGLLLNARLAACDLGYLTIPEFIQTMEKTFETVRRLPKCNGHFYNWYETDSLRPVSPLFVSTVDNGNLVASLWALKHGCLDLIEGPLFPCAVWAGLRDIAIELSEAARKGCAGSDLVPLILDLRQRAEEIASSNSIPMEEMRSLEVDALLILIRATRSGQNDELVWWARELSSHIAGLLAMLSTLEPWLETHGEAGCFFAEAEIRELHKGLSLESIPRIYREVGKKLEDEVAAGHCIEQAKHLLAVLEKSVSLAGDYMRRLQWLASTAQSIADEMDFSVLFDATKKQFSIGYEQSEGAIRRSNYDLLASEARTAVFVAIAKGEAPQESWFELKRSHRSYKGETVLLSWSGTAFEYLMPALWLRGYPNTLLDRGIRSLIRAQQAWTQHSGIPWGISESSCAERNPDGHYRYHAFGLPGAALHRDDCSGDLVIAPYATFLAMMFDTEGALKNLRKLTDLGLLSTYGFYEAVDFTPKRNKEAGGHVVVQNWMAHHQGMSLVAAANVLCGSVMQRRFHAEPRVTAIERLLHERRPRALAYEEDVEVLKESGSALADLVSLVPHPGLRDLSPKTS